jgi:hypothetical protein
MGITRRILQIIGKGNPEVGKKSAPFPEQLDVIVKSRKSGYP